MKNKTEFNEKIISTYSEFQNILSEIKVKYSHQKILYRGHSKISYDLNPTILRSEQNIANSLRAYLKIIIKYSYQIDAFSNTKTDFSEITKWANNHKYETTDIWEIFANLEIYNLLAHFRHYGFPSPLLDWTESPEIALLFALNSEENKENACIYVYIERPSFVKIGMFHKNIVSFGPYLVREKRHVLQKSNYTIACEYDYEKNDFNFIEYNNFNTTDPSKQDYIFKFEISKKYRMLILKKLDEYNLNIYSIMQNKESMMKYFTFKELLNKYNV